MNKKSLGKGLCVSIAILGLLAPLNAEDGDANKENTEAKTGKKSQKAPQSSSRLFYYLGIKGGYSFESISKSVFASTADNKSSSLDASSASAIPLGAGVGLGYVFPHDVGLRFEVEYIYRTEANFKEKALNSNNDENPQQAQPFMMHPKAKFQSLLGNLYLDYYFTPSFNIYLGVGLGMSLGNAVISYNEPTKSNGLKGDWNASSKTLTWQVGGGVGYAFTENFAIDLNVRYIDFGKTKFEPLATLPASSSLPFSAIEALLGLNYRF